MPQQNKYKDLSDKLDDVLRQLQNPEADIDEALELYKRGQKITSELEQYLKAAENTIRKLKPQGNK